MLLCLNTSAAFGAEWWHGSFVNEGSKTCEDNDSLIIFQDQMVSPWETSCKVLKKTQVTKMDAIILDLQCSYPDAPEERTEGRKILMKLQNGSIASYSSIGGDVSIQTLSKCQR